MERADERERGGKVNKKLMNELGQRRESRGQWKWEKMKAGCTGLYRALNYFSYAPASALLI